MPQVFGIARSDLAIDPQADVGPAADPVAVVEIGVACIAVAHVGFVITAAGTDGARPASVALDFTAKVPAGDEVGLGGAIDARGDVPELVRVGVDEAMAR